MSQLNYAEIMDVVEYYANSTELRELHRRAEKSFYPLFAMTHQTQLPEHMTRGVTVDMPSPRLRDLRRSLLSTMTSYSSIVTVNPNADGTPNGELKTKADKVERGLSVVRAEWNTGGMLRADMYHQELVGPYYVGIMQCGDIEAGGMPWKIISPDPLSCYFPVSGSPARPMLMARRYKQLVRDIETTYAGRPRTEHHDAKPAYRNGKWTWEPLSADVSIESGAFLSGSGGSAKYGEEVEFVWFDDGEYIYHIALDGDNPRDSSGRYSKRGGGEIVWCGKNLTGGCSAIVICGDPTPAREVKEMLAPALLPVMQTTLNINLIRSIRATKSLQAKPDMLIEMTPEAFAMARNEGLLSQVQLEEGVPNMITVGGTPVPWKMEPDVDLDKLEISWKEEQDQYVSSWKEPTDPKTVADTTANAYLTAVQAIRLNQTDLLKAADWAEAQWCKMALHSLKEGYKTEINLYASGSVVLKGGEIQAGGGVKLGPDDLDFDYTVNVTTKAQTDSDLRAREEHGMWRVDQGIGSREEVIEGSYVDASAQIAKLAIDAGYRAHEPTMLQYVDAAWRDKVRLRAGILLPMPMQPMVPGAGGDSANGQSPMMPAAIGGPEGGAM